MIAFATEVTSLHAKLDHTTVVLDMTTTTNNINNVINAPYGPKALYIIKVCVLKMRVR